MTNTTGTLERTHLSALLAPYRGGLPFAVATRSQAAQRRRMARLTVMSRTWAHLRGLR